MLVIIFVKWVLERNASLPISSWFLDHYQQLLTTYKQNPIVFIFVFCGLHFFSALFSIPGSCTFLNISAGALFGFFPAVMIVYPITLISGITGYLLGRLIPLNIFPEKVNQVVNKLKKYILASDFLNLVMLRLSPFFPYGILNIVFGIMHVNFLLFCLTTFVGIFFDVVLLTSAGAFITRSSDSNALESSLTTIVFFSLFISVYFVKIFIDKKQVGD